MRIRTLLLSSVVFGSVAMLASVSWSQTSPKVVYKPQGNWSVTRMAAKGPGKDPYCTMARRFGDNVVLTFARNAKDETSLAMDFQPDTLAKGQSYYVVLDAGADEKRAFDVSPVSDKAMIIRLGQDEKFHDALNRSGVLNVDVAGLQFEFNVPDMTKGQEDLGNCIATVIQPAAGERAKVASAKPMPIEAPAREPSPEPMKMAATPLPMEEESIEAEPLKMEDVPVVRRASDDILAAPATKMMREVPADLAVPPMAALKPIPSVVPAENEKQSFEAESLREENLRLKNALARERREYEDRSMKENSGSSQVSEIMEKMKLLETENSDLKYRLADARSSGVPQPMVPGSVSAADPKLEEEVARLRDENAALQSKITAQLLAKGEIDPKAADEISKLREENASLQSQVLTQKTTGGDADSKLASEIAKLRDENMALKANAQKMPGVGVDPKMVNEIAILRQENATLKANMAAKKVVTAEGSPQLSDEIAILKDENASLREELSAQKMAMASLEPKAGQKAANKAADSAVIARMQARIDDLSAQNDKLQSDIVSAQITAAPVTPVTKDNGITVSQLRSVEEQLRAVENERNNLRAQIEKASDGKEDGLIKLSGSDWNLEQATRRFNESEREIRRLGMQLEQSRSQCMAEKKEIEYKLFDPEIANQEQINKLMSLENEVDAAKAELARKDAEVSSLQAKLNSSGQRMASIAPAAGVSSAPVERVAVVPVSATPIAAPVPTPPPVAAISVPAPAPVASAPVVAPQGERMATSSLDEDIRPRSVRFDPVSMPNTQPTSAGAEIVARRPAVSQEALMPMGGESAEVSPMMPQPVIQQPVVQVVTKASPIARQATPSVTDAGTKLLTADALSSQLRQSGLTLSGDVKKIEKVSGPAFVAYSWNTDGLFGTAEQKPMTNPEQFQTMVNQYLDKTKSRCNGDFAASPVPTQSVPGVNVASYEVACIGADSAGATAALVFYGKDGLFTTVAHESGMDTMDTAMDARDRVIAGLASNKTTN